ncbi:MAG: 4Fe-4S binding protein [Bacteroidota bacterium]|nr:4Fe-4S binding protein [Bacteroidota bacterium]
MIREIIKIDEEKCNGCGLCIPACPEGALQIIDGKARLVSDLMCDGLGACLGECPEGAIEVEKREAEPYDEVAVMKEMVKKGRNTVEAHLKHLQDHGEFAFLNQAVGFLKNNQDSIDFDVDDLLNGREEKPEPVKAHGMGCPGSAIREFNVSLDENEKKVENPASLKDSSSQLRQWPVQMHLINPKAGYFQNSEVLLAADCVAFAIGDFHQRFLKGKSVAIACPKLDQGKEIYINKLIQLIDESNIQSMDVVVMEVPCCSGLLQMAQIARQNAGRHIPIKHTVIGVDGRIVAKKDC